MLRRGRGRPRKHACSDGVLKSSQTALHLIGKALHRKQLKLRRHRILELANANFCSTISKPRRSLRDLKHFARQLGKGAVPSLYPFCQQRASGVLADHRGGSQCSLGHVDWNSSGSRDFAPQTAILGSTRRSSENEDSDFVHDAHVDQWVGVEVILCGRKSSIGEVGSTTSNVCGELRSVVVDPEREQICASFSKNLNPAPNGFPTQRAIIANRGENDEGRKAKHGVVPSWLNFRRNMTRKRRINTSGGISDCHKSALIASLPKTWSHIGTKVTSPKIIASTEEIGLQPCADQGAANSVDNSCAAVISVDQSSEVIIPVEQSFASQESNVNSGQGSSLDFGQERQVNTCVLQSDAIQVCPTTPEKAQKRRRNYQDTISEHDVRGMDSFELSDDGVPTVSNFPPNLVGGISGNSLSADDDSGKDANDGLALMGDVILSSFSVEFESSCNSTGIGELGLNVAGVEVPGSLVNSVPTPAMTNPFDSISHVASVISDVILDAVRESSQLFQTQVRSTTVFDTDSNVRKEERVTFKLNKKVGGTAIAPKIRKKYKPRVAKDKSSYKRYGSGLQKKTDGHTLDHGASKHGRTEVVHHQIIRSGVRRDISARDSCTSQSYFCGNHTNHTREIGESRSSFFQEETAGPRAGELACTPVISTSPERLPPSADNGCRTRNVLEEDELSPHPHWSSNVEQDRIASHSLLCTSCELERRITGDRSEIVQTKQINNLTSSNEDLMVSDSIIRRQKQFEMLSNELSNRVLALLDLPSIGQPHSLCSIAGGFERSPSMQASDFVRCYAEAALRKYIDEDGFSSFSEDWTASQSGLELNAADTFSAEMTTQDASFPERTALDASNEEAIDFDLFYKEHLSAGLEDTLIQSLNDELNEFDSAIADTCLRGSHVTEDQFGVQDLLCKPQCELAELDIGACQPPNLWPSSVRRSIMAQAVFPESMEDRTMSSFYASTSAGVNIMMLSRLNEILEQNVQQSNLRNRNAEKELSMSAMTDCGQTEVPSTGSEQRSAEGFKNLGLSEDYSYEDEDLMIPQESGLYQLSSQFQNSNPDSNFATEFCDIVNPVRQIHSKFATESVIVAAEISSDLEDCSVYNATLNQACPRKKVCPAKTPFHLITYVQLVAYLKIVLTHSSEMSPLQMLRHVQAHLPDKEKLEFKKLWPMILHPVNSEQLQKLADLAEIDLPPYMEETQDKQMEGQDDRNNEDYHWAPCTEMIPDELRRRPGTGANDGNHLPPCMEAFQYQQIERWDEGATEDNHLAACKEIVQYSQIGRGYEKARRINHWAPCMEVIQYQHTEQQIERRNVEAQEGNHLTDLVPYVGNAIVAYDGSFFPLRKRKPRPKVDLDIETIRVWKLLMGKTETLEDDPDIDNELKWKQERIIMQGKVENFIRCMHSIQGDRSFSRWKGSVVDSVVGVFLTQNVSDVLSSSAFMCLRARFPSRRSRRSLQIEPPDKGIGDILENDVHINPAPVQTLQEPQSSCFHGISSSCANEPRPGIPASQESGHEKSNTSNSETRQVDILLPLGSESHGSLSLGCQQEGIELYSVPEQPPATDTSVNVSAIASELNSCSITSRKCHGNSNASALEMMLEDTPFLSGSESQQPFTSFLEQGENMTHSNKCTGNSFELSTHSITNAECSLTEEVMMSSIESQFELLLLPPETNGANVAFTQELQNEEKLSTINVALTGLERAKMEADQVRTRKPCKWDALAEKYNARCQQAAMDLATPRTEMTEDGVDWEAVRCADLEEIADAIKERGMNWKLAGRIKGLLERLRLEQGGIDLEWLRSIPNDDAKEFLSSVHGLGLKSVECIRLLALHHNAFPVDTNVGRICVRLGWVPLEPLPEELQLHVLELYPVQATIQKYLWPRLCTLDQQTLYELHYQLITFGKVFCTKSKPNCNACPMRSDCKHFASVLSSAKLALPASDSTSGRGATLALPPGSCSATEVGEGPPQPAKTGQSSMCMSQYCQPIIEEPMTPESEADMTDCDIEDEPFSVEEVEVVSAIELYRPEIQGQQDMHQQNKPNRCCNLSTTLSESENVHEMYMADSETLAQEEAQPKVVSPLLDSAQVVVDYDGEGGGFNVLSRAAVLFSDAPSGEVVLLPPGAASIPVPKLKNIERLRTVHYVYELPDNHPLLDAMDIREADDPCFYLLAIWSPDEVPESIPNINDDNEETSYTSFDFPRDEECIKATLLVPCRTAMQGSFPLNGTYFQVNEVFADHESSLQPMLVPRVLLWNLRRRFVYFGTSVTSILRGMTTEEIQACFSRGYVCVRGFDWTTRAPKPLVRRLHFQTNKSISRSSPTKNTKT